ncbi:MAG: response regulator transcription factor [Henriciella sp.]|jgi:two-component system response regulator FixJ
MTKRVYLVDDDDAIRHSASFMLRHAGYMVKTFRDGPHFLDNIVADETGCILLDIRMPGMDGLAVQAELKARGIHMPVIILTGHGDVTVAVAAMKAGAIEFLEKPYEKKALLAAIDTAFERLSTQSGDARMKAEAAASIATLTAREKDVLHYLVDGMTNKAIAEALSISPRTVEIHRANLMEKLGAESLSAALRLAFLADLNR